MYLREQLTLEPRTQTLDGTTCSRQRVMGRRDGWHTRQPGSQSGIKTIERVIGVHEIHAELTYQRDQSMQRPWPIRGPAMFQTDGIEPSLPVLPLEKPVGYQIDHVISHVVRFERDHIPQEHPTDAADVQARQGVQDAHRSPGAFLRRGAAQS